MNGNKVLWLVLGIAPAVIMGVCIAKYGVNVPHWDQWDTPAQQIIRASQGSVGWNDWFSQHNEGRPLFPKLVSVGLASLGGWHVKREMFITFGLACLVSCELYLLSRRTLSLGSRYALALLAISNWLLFTPAQWDNWFWGFQFALWIPIACILAGLILLNSTLRASTQFLGCGFLATLSSFSFANGMLAWVVLLPAIGVTGWVNHRRNWWMPAGWLLWMAATMLVYFFNYQKPGGHPGIGAALGQPLHAIAFFLAYLGSSFGFGDLYASMGAGLILLCLCTILCIHIYRRITLKGESIVLQQALPWLSIGGYAVLSALLSAAGRVGFGVGTALASKYMTFSVFLPIALVYGLSLVAPSSPACFNLPKRSKVIALGLAGMLTVGSGLTYAFGWRSMVKNYDTRSFAKVCLMLINVVQEADCVEAHNALYPARALVKERSNRLNDQGMLRPRLADATILDSFQSGGTADSYGEFSRFDPDADGHFMAQGWAFLPEIQQPAAAVVLTYTTEQGDLHPLQVVRVGDPKPELAPVVGRSARRVGWTTTVIPASLPRDAKSITAWAFNVDSQTAHPLHGEYAIP